MFFTRLASISISRDKQDSKNIANKHILLDIRTACGGEVYIVAFFYLYSQYFFLNSEVSKTTPGYFEEM